MLTLALAFIAVGGAKAAKTNWNPSTAIATWNGETQTMAWTTGDTNGWHVMNSGLPTGDLSTAGYTKLHIEIASITNDIGNPYIIVKIASTDKDDQYVPIYVGVNNIVFNDYSTNIDFSKVTEISFWGSGNEGSAVITDCYLYGPVKAIPDFSNEITTLGGITSGQKFVIANSDASKVMYFKGNVDSHNIEVESVPTDGYFYYQATKVNGLDTDNDGNTEDDNYIIQIFNGTDDVFVSDWNFGSYLNHSTYGHTFAATAASGVNKNYGWDYEFAGIWKISKEEDGFVFQCAGGSKVYLKVDGTSASKVYLKLFESINFAANTDLEKEDNAANTSIFAFSNATGYNAEAGTLTNGTWTFATPVDLSDWDYLVMALANGGADDTHKITITDNSGNSISGDEYVGVDAGTTGPNMYFSRYNNQSIACISMDYLRKVKNIDIFHIKSLSIEGTITPSVFYLTDCANAKLMTANRWNLYPSGDLTRNYTSSTVGKFGTICLPYKASYAGCEVYSITGKTENSITLEKVTGLLEAGKPYFYKATDVVGHDNGEASGNDEHNVNFFRADLAKFDAAAGTNNGLVGTFAAITAPKGTNYYVLSSNKLYQVNSDVTVGANKAYVDISQITTSAPELGAVTIEFNNNNTTGISAVNDSEFMVNGSDIYNLNGQRVAQPTKGLYIVNGKKVVIK